MNHVDPTTMPSSNQLYGQASDDTAAQLVGQVYEAAPAAERGLMLEQLMRPLGVLSIVAVANGIFAKLWFRSPREYLQIRIEDIQGVSSADVIALFHYARQVSFEAVDGLIQVLSSFPVSAWSPATGLLLTMLVERTRSVRSGGTENVETSNGASAASTQLNRTIYDRDTLQHRTAGRADVLNGK